MGRWLLRIMRRKRTPVPVSGSLPHYASQSRDLVYVFCRSYIVFSKTMRVLWIALRDHVWTLKMGEDASNPDKGLKAHVCKRMRSMRAPVPCELSCLCAIVIIVK